MSSVLVPISPDVPIPDPLPGMAERIYIEMRKARGATATALEHARAAGELLQQAKDQLPHGRWLAWLKQHADVDPSTAAYYMAIARHFYVLREQMDRDPNVLPVREARRLLTNARAAWKAGLLEGAPMEKVKEQEFQQGRRSRLATLADQIRRYDQRRVHAQRKDLIELRKAIDAALKTRR